jgi:hypothetical protein
VSAGWVIVGTVYGGDPDGLVQFVVLLVNRALVVTITYAVEDAALNVKWPRESVVPDATVVPDWVTVTVAFARGFELHPLTVTVVFPAQQLRQTLGMAQQSPTMKS